MKSTWVTLPLLWAVFAFTHIICTTWQKVKFPTFTITISLKRLESIVSKRSSWSPEAKPGKLDDLPRLELLRQRFSCAIHWGKQFVQTLPWNDILKWSYSYIFFLGGGLHLTSNNCSYCLRSCTQQEGEIKISSNS